MTKRGPVAALVLNWNGWQETIQCVQSLQRLKTRVDIIIIDNGSTDDSETILRAAFPGLGILQTGANRGFAGGMNYGIRFALERGYEFIWLLNNDVTVDSSAASALLETARDQSMAGAIGCKIFSSTEPIELTAYGGGRIFWNRATTRHVFSFKSLDYLTGASLFIRASALRQVGLLDEQFFMYWEDVDFSIRLQENGWKLAVAERALIYHKEKGSKGSVQLDRIHNTSTHLFILKYGLSSFVAWRCALGRMTKRAISGDFERAKIIWSTFRLVRTTHPPRPGE